MGDVIGGAMAQRPLHFFFVLDVSGSMGADGKIQALNHAIREALPHVREAAEANPGVQVFVRALAFANAATWVVADPLPISEFRWADIDAEPRGLTELGLALRLLAVQMRKLAEDARGFAPAIVLVSDGMPTDTVEPSFRRGMAELLAEPWGAKASRLAVAIGRDADRGILKEFIGRGELEPVLAENPDQLVRWIRWASTVAVSEPVRLADATIDASSPSGDDRGSDTVVW
jgi:uncharacterized protein YegL